MNWKRRNFKAEVSRMLDSDDTRRSLPAGPGSRLWPIDYESCQSSTTSNPSCMEYKWGCQSKLGYIIISNILPGWGLGGSCCPLWRRCSNMYVKQLTLPTMSHWSGPNTAVAAERRSILNWESHISCELNYICRNKEVLSEFLRLIDSSNTEIIYFS